MRYIKNLINQKYKIVYFLDIMLLILVVTIFFNDLFYFIISIYGKISNISNDIVCFMSSNSNNVTNTTSSMTHSVNTQIIHDDGSWSNAIRSLFIYGSGGYRLYLTRGGTPSSRFIITGSTILADNISRIITNAINDPAYITNHLNA